MYRTNGFTLVEMMITLVIGAILVTVAVPGFMELTRRNAVITTSNELLSSILLARSEAIRLEANTTVTLAADNWRVDTGATNHVISTVDNSNVSLAGNISGAANEITYNSMGRAALAVGDSIDVSFDGDVISHVCLSITGRPYIRSESEGGCP
jgi:type IV fimbrial biogenesis protein FimT